MTELALSKDLCGKLLNLSDNESFVREGLEKLLSSLKSTLLDQDTSMRETALKTIIRLIACFTKEQNIPKTATFLTKVYGTGITKFIFENLFLIQSDSPDLESVVSQYKLVNLSLGIILVLGSISERGHPKEFFEEAYKSKVVFHPFLSYTLTHRPRRHRQLLAMAEATGNADKRTLLNIKEKSSTYNLIHKRALELALKYCLIAIREGGPRGKDLLGETHLVLARALGSKGVPCEEEQALAIFEILFRTGGCLPGSYTRKTLKEYFEKVLPASRWVVRPGDGSEREEARRRDAEEAVLKLGVLYAKTEPPCAAVDALCKAHPDFFARTWAASCVNKSPRGDRLIMCWFTIFINFAERTPAIFCKNEGYAHFKRPVLRYALASIGRFVDEKGVDLAKCFVFCFLRASFGEVLNRTWRGGLERIQSASVLMHFLAEVENHNHFHSDSDLMRTIIAIAACEIGRGVDNCVHPRTKPPEHKRPKQNWECEARFFQSEDIHRLVVSFCEGYRTNGATFLEPFEMECLIRIAFDASLRHKSAEYKRVKASVRHVVTERIFEYAPRNCSNVPTEEVFRWLVRNRKDLTDNWIGGFFVPSVVKNPQGILPFIDTSYMALILRECVKNWSVGSGSGDTCFSCLLDIAEWGDGLYLNEEGVQEVILKSAEALRQMSLTCKNKATMARFMRITLVGLFSAKSDACPEHTEYLFSISRIAEPLFGSLPADSIDRDEILSFFLTVLALLDPQNKSVVHTEECAAMYAILLAKCSALIRNALALIGSLVRDKDSRLDLRQFDLESSLCLLAHSIKSKLNFTQELNLTTFTQLIKVCRQRPDGFAVASAIFKCGGLCLEKGCNNEINSVRELVLYALDYLFCQDKETRDKAADFVRSAAERCTQTALCYVRKQPKHYFCTMRILKMTADGMPIELSHAKYLGTLAKLIRPEWLARMGAKHKSTVVMAVEALRSQLSKCLFASPLSRELRTSIDGLEALYMGGSTSARKEYFSEQVAIETVPGLTVKTTEIQNRVIKYFAF